MMEFWSWPLEPMQIKIIGDTSGWVKYAPWAAVAVSFLGVLCTGFFAWQQKNISQGVEKIADEQRKIADQQKEIANGKLKLDLSNRRFEAWGNFRKVIISTERFIFNNIEKYANISEEEFKLLSVPEEEKDFDRRAAVMQMEMLFPEEIIGKKCNEIMDYYIGQINKMRKCFYNKNHNDFRRFCFGYGISVSNYVRELEEVYHKVLKEMSIYR
ncbi:hypothetical protein [Oecophyllibacter saccharovorans]|uniref:DUF4760 domain-containing protein n=1 Tax=Oecophyllibacter saccharovorans TaxID=2558360 RepID=A0A506URW0_9PROT|nr:hypothetical protein [Oecophyllibacter saccharovorans]TPW36091.1 hypothetical protein E3202_04135 [Oecophyllibacter saccharovorans]